MAKRKVVKRQRSTARPRRGDPVALRARFLSVAMLKNARHMKEFAEGFGGTPPTSAREIGFWGVVRAGIREALCRRTEENLDKATQFLRDNWKDLSQEERDKIEGQAADLLDSYAENC